MQLLHRYSSPEILRFIPALIFPSSVKLGDSLEDTVTTVHPRATPRDHSFHLPLQDIAPHLNATLCVSVHQIQACRINPSGRFSTSIYLSGNWIFVCFSFSRVTFFMHLHMPVQVCMCRVMCVHTHVQVCMCMFTRIYMPVQVCMCIAMCVHMPVQVCMCIFMCAHMPVQMCVYIHMLNVLVQMCVYIYVHTRLCKCVCIFTCAHVLVQMCVYIHVHTHACASLHVYIHTRTRVCLSLGTRRPPHVIPHVPFTFWNTSYSPG